MKKRSVKGLLMSAVLGVVLCAGMTSATTVSAKEQTKASIRVIEEGASKAIDLAGNSVVIRESENDSDCVNIYVDENVNGIVDEAEQAVALNLGGVETEDIEANVTIYGLKGTTSDFPLTITVESGTLATLYGVSGGTLNNTLKMDIKGGTIRYGLYGIDSGTVIAPEGEKALDMNVSGNTIVNSFYGIRSFSGNADVTGDVDIKWDTKEVAPEEKERTSPFYVIENNATVNGDVSLLADYLYVDNLCGFAASSVISGDAVIDVKAGSANAVYLTTDTLIAGSLSVDIREDYEVMGEYRGCSGGRISGDVNINLNNAYEGEGLSSTPCRVLVSDVSVLGNATITINGGNYDEVRPIYGASSFQSYVGGQVDLTVKNMKCRELIPVLYAIVMEDVNITVENVDMPHIFGICDSIVLKKVKMDIKDSVFDSNTSNSSCFLIRSQYQGGAEINVINTTAKSGRAFIPCVANQDGSGDIVLNFRNVQFDNDNIGAGSYSLCEGQKMLWNVYVDAKVGETSTQENPLSNVAGIARMLLGSADAVIVPSGELPEGLEMVGGKIFGTPTKAYPDGKNVTFTVKDEYKKEDMSVCFVVAKRDCEFDSQWTGDDTHHWHACTDQDCDEVEDKEVHTWDAGVVTKEATETEKGTKTYACLVCNGSKTEEIPVKQAGQTEPPSGTPSETPSEPPTQTPTDTPADSNEIIPAAKGTVLPDDDKNGEYTVTNASVTNPEVSYKPVNKKASEIVIPKEITVNGVTYKVTSIQKNAFRDYKKLKKVTIGANVTKIGNGAFQNCVSLKKIVIPSKVAKIGSKAFYGCKKLTSITIKTIKLTTKNVGKDAFKKAGSSNYKKLKVKVPKKKFNSYKTMLKKRGLSAKAKVKK